VIRISRDFTDTFNKAKWSFSTVRQYSQLPADVDHCPFALEIPGISLHFFYGAAKSCPIMPVKPAYHLMISKAAIANTVKTNLD
jgi:hypothetical protein